MPTTLTLDEIPDDLYARLKETAKVHHRSLNSEAISVLEAALLPRKAATSERIVKARALRAPLKQGAFLSSDIDAFKRIRRQ